MPRGNTRILITEAAIRVAAKHGISGATMDEIAEEAGVAKGSLYYNFASKDAIFEHVLRDGFGQLHAALAAARNAAQPGDVRQLAAATLRQFQAAPELARIMAAELFRTDRPWFISLEVVRESVTAEFRDVLREAFVARGGSARDAQAITDTAGAALFGAVAGACIDWLLFRPEQSVEHVLEQIFVLG